MRGKGVGDILQDALGGRSADFHLRRSQEEFFDLRRRRRRGGVGGVVDDRILSLEEAFALKGEELGGGRVCLNGAAVKGHPGVVVAVRVEETRPEVFVGGGFGTREDGIRGGRDAGEGES